MVYMDHALIDGSSVKNGSCMECAGNLPFVSGPMDTDADHGHGPHANGIASFKLAIQLI